MKGNAMFSNTLKIMCALLFCGAMLAQAGCGMCGTAKGCAVTKAPCEKPRGLCDKGSDEMTAALPSNAKAGECYAKVFVPPQFKTVTERVLVRDASETIEIVPATYEWVEEKVLVKDASTQLEAVDAEFATRERTLQVNSGHTDWEVNKNALCVNPKEQPARDVFCLVNHPPVEKTYQIQALVKPAHVQEVCVPAQYETVRRQKLVSAATTRKVCIPAEYENIEKTQKICDGRMAWKRIICDTKLGTDETVTINANGKPSNATVNAKLAIRP
jgi:hypothetical protein